MRRFHGKILDENIEGTSPIFSSPEHNKVLGLAEDLSLFFLTDTVNAASITITAQIEQSADQMQWQNKAPTPEVDAVAISPSLVTTIVVRDDGTVPSCSFLRLRVSLGGTGAPKAHVRLWATARRGAL